MNQSASLFPSQIASANSVQYDVSLRALNTFGIEAKAYAYLAVQSMADLLLAKTWLAQAAHAQLPILVLGGGSNLVLRADFPGLVLHMCAQGISVVGEDQDCVYVRAAAGTAWHSLVQWSLQQGLGGLENLSLIPGTVGAAPIQNIGAYGVELKDCFKSASVFDWHTGDVLEFDRAACAFGYRDSVFKHAWRERGLILDVCFALPKRWQAQLGYAELAKHFEQLGITPTAQQVSEAVIAIRQRKLPDPAQLGNAGSFFKNPLVSAEQRNRLLAAQPQLVSYAQADGSYKLAAGWLIEKAGWKGQSLGVLACMRSKPWSWSTMAAQQAAKCWLWLNGLRRMFGNNLVCS